MAHHRADLHLRDRDRADLQVLRASPPGPQGAPAAVLRLARASLRHRHLPLHGRRGVDETAARARRRTTRSCWLEHRRVLREAFARHGGVEVDTQGDAFFVAFAEPPTRSPPRATGRPRSATGRSACASDLHTGEPIVTDEGYVGIDVHRAARIAGAGHGGQVLVSRSTRDLARRRRPARSRRAPPEGPDGAGAHLPARRRRLPAAEDAPAHEPARAADAVPRSGRRARRGR